MRTPGRTTTSSKRRPCSSRTGQAANLRDIPNILLGHPNPLPVSRKRLVELKARYEAHERARGVLAAGTHLDTLRQEDTYFALGERRLKLRTIDGRRGAVLVYYERQDIAGLKESDVVLYDVADPVPLKEILVRLLGIRVVVRKRREIYRYREVQVHLDEVEGLGRFLEFELPVVDTPEGIETGRARLAAMRNEFGIPDEDLVASSYSDLLAD